MRFTFHKDKEVHLELEECFDGVFFHITVAKWNKATYQKCIELFLESTEWCKSRGYDTGYVLLTGNFIKTMKFAMMFGWESLVYCEQTNTLLMYQEI